MPLSALKFHFLQITFFSAVITRTHHLPTHTPFFLRHIMSKKRALHLFLKITFFCSVLLLLTPETLPNHLFRQTNHQKKLKSSLKKKKNFLFFYNLFQIFPLPLRKKTKPLTFFPLFITGNRKTGRENVLLKTFFFFLTFFHPTTPRNRKNYHLPFFSKFLFKMPKNADKRPQVSFFTNYLFFRRDYADTYTYPHTLRFSDTLCLKNALNTFFLKLHFFPLYSFSLPPKHVLIIFPGKLATKNGQKTSRNEEKISFLFL